MASYVFDATPIKVKEKATKPFANATRNLHS